MSSELEDSAVTVGTGRDNANVSWVVDGSDDTRSKDELLPVKVLVKEKEFSSYSARSLRHCQKQCARVCQTARLSRAKIVETRAEQSRKQGYHRIPGLANVDHIDTIGTSLPEVRLHVRLQVLRTEMALSSEEHLNVLGGGIEARGEVLSRGSHGGSLWDDIRRGRKRESKTESCQRISSKPLLGREVVEGSGRREVA